MEWSVCQGVSGSVSSGSRGTEGLEKCQGSGWRRRCWSVRECRSFQIRSVKADGVDKTGERSGRGGRVAGVSVSLSPLAWVGLGLSLGVMAALRVRCSGVVVSMDQDDGFSPLKANFSMLNFHLSNSRHSQSHLALVVK